MVNLQRSSKVALALIMMFFIINSNTSQYRICACNFGKTPPQNGVISKAPDTLELTFNEPVNAEYSGITIYNDKVKGILILQQPDILRHLHFLLIKFNKGHSN